MWRENQMPSSPERLHAELGFPPVALVGKALQELLKRRAVVVALVAVCYGPVEERVLLGFLQDSSKK